MQTTDRRTYLDMMRIVAVFFVIFNHLDGYVLFIFSNGVKQWIYLFITTITRMNVPLFFMVSGALLLGKNESWKVILKKRVVRYIGVILLFSVGLYLLSAAGEQDFVISVKGFILAMLQGNVESSYWFLYSYLGMVLSLPFLRAIAQKITKEDFLALFVLHFLISSFLPIANIVFMTLLQETVIISEHFQLWFAGQKALFYPLIGYYLDKGIVWERISKSKIRRLSFISVVGILTASACTYYVGKTSEWTDYYTQMFDYLTAIWIFVLTKWLFMQNRELNQGRFSRIICTLGGLSFGIYLLDPYFKKLFLPTFNNFLKPLLPTLIVSILWCLLSMSLGGMITYILKRIPRIKKLL